jgi:hypothetical protein
VGDEDSVKLMNVFADCGQPSCNFATAEAGIDQDTRPVSRNEGCVAGTAAR